MYSTPILFLIFNRPETTQKVFDIIKKQQPKYLYIAADGPRCDRPQDFNLCQKSREIVLKIDWDCEVKTLFRDKNLGCGVAVYEAITWFFGHVLEGVILEDDTLPHQTFFHYCENMLEHFRNDENVMHISGSYFLESLSTSISLDSYYFTKHIHVWGWATWRRSWQEYDYYIKEFEIQKTRKSLFNYYGEYWNFWKGIYLSIFNKEIDTWDYQWMFAIYLNNGIAINPTKNLVKNIGFGDDATHTKDINSIYTKVETSCLSKIVHPAGSTLDSKRDSLYYTHFLNFSVEEEIAKRNILWKLKKYMQKLKRKLNGSIKKIKHFQINKERS